mmetsp:Transcript_21035/g.59835  ORF Transcript_21035/g.59835 Transcript_21035/m.59835 type:complete len:377 (-) Transcript_21035:2011-3141(-)
MGDADAERPADGAGKRKNHNKYRRDKPWDNEDIDHWKVDEWKPEFMPAPMAEESSFATLFPAYREKYLQEVWPAVTRLLKKEGIACELNLIEGSMTVRTTRKTADPYVILKARDLIKLLARSIPVEQAAKILQDGTECDVIKIGGLVRNKDRFVKRRQRLVGPNGQTLKAIELLTGCYVLVQGNTVAAMGPFKGLKQVRKIIIDCMKNVHPIYNIKELMIKRELAKDPELANEDWSRFLPHFNRNVQKRPKKSAEDKQKAKKVKKKYTPFPPAQQPSKVDLQLESGEYFLSEAQRQKARQEERKQHSANKARERDVKRKQVFEAPAEKGLARKRRAADGPDVDADLSALQASVASKIGKTTSGKKARKAGNDSGLA